MTTAEILGSKPYSSYKASGISWLGAIPDHWFVKRGKELLKKTEKPVSEDDEVITCFRNGEVTLRRNRRTEGFTESLKEIGYQGIRKGDLVIHEMDAFAGSVGVSDSDGKGTPVYSVCEPASNANTYYYALVIREMARSQWILCLAKGIRERSTDFRYATLSAEQLPVPPLDEQKAIVRYLDDADQRILAYVSAKERLITLLEEERLAIIQQAVTRGLDANVRLKPSGVEWLGDIPEHWLVERGKQLLKKMERPTSECDEVITCFRDGEVTLRKNRRTDGFTESLQEIGYQGIRKGDLVIHQMDAFAGSIGVSDSDGKGTPVYSVCKPTPHANADYYAHTIREMARSQWILALTKGIRERSTDFRYATLTAELLPVPPTDEQAVIVKHLEKTTTNIKTGTMHARRQIDLMAEYRTRLIADVVTGKIDVREAAERLPDLNNEDRPAEHQSLSNPTINVTL